MDGLVSLVTSARSRGPPPLRAVLVLMGALSARPSVRRPCALGRLHSAAVGKTTFTGLKFSLLPTPGHAEPALACRLGPRRRRRPRWS